MCGKRRSRPPTCPYCGQKSVLRDISSVFPGNSSKKKVYVCKNFPEKCDAYVFANRKNEPLGQLANRELRLKRIAAHKVFNQLWESGMMKKGQAYRWLAAKFGLNPAYAHIACFSDYYCDRRILECEEILKVRKATQAIKSYREVN